MSKLFLLHPSLSYATASEFADIQSTIKETFWITAKYNFSCQDLKAGEHHDRDHWEKACWTWKGRPIFCISAKIYTIILLKILFMIISRYIRLTLLKLRRIIQSTVWVSLIWPVRKIISSSRRHTVLRTQIVQHTLQEETSPTWPLLCASFWSWLCHKTNPSSSTWLLMTLTGKYLPRITYYQKVGKSYLMGVISQWNYLCRFS